MISFCGAILLLIAGYAIYGKVVEKVFGPDQRQTPAVAHDDGVDYVPMPTWRVFMIQLLNIAGTGPIFGALMGAVFGPVVFLWIVFGSILGGAVHDYMSGMISLRLDGASLPEIVGRYLGPVAKQGMRIFSLILLVLLGAVFTTSPALLIARLTPEWMDAAFWVVVILLYYFLATLLPIDKLIGKLYPFFGAVLLLMAVGIIVGLLAGGYSLPEVSLVNQNPQGKPIWPFMFITVACGAISGFHGTQSPMMARCLRQEKDGRRVFYGAMIAESVIALVWAAAGVAFYGATGGLQAALTSLGQSGVVYEISVSLLGIVGGALAVIGVVVCPVTSGDTAFRSARLIVADWLHWDQARVSKRLIITVPLLAAGAALTQVDFDVVWRYFSWSNQTLAMITLWAAAMYLIRRDKPAWHAALCAVPAAFMSGVSCTYILMAEEGFRFAQNIAYPVGMAFALVCMGVFVFRARIRRKAQFRF